MSGRSSGVQVARPSGTQVVVAVLLALLGFAAAVQVRATVNDDEFTGARQGDLISLITTLTLATERAPTRTHPPPRTGRRSRP